MLRSNQYEAYIKSSLWRTTSNTLKRHFGYVCKRCGYFGWDVEVHHLNYERLGRELMSDLEVLCKPCHKKADHARAVANAAACEERREERRQEAAYETYMRKKYGDHWYDHDGCDSREEFDEWLRGKEENAWRDSY